MEATSPRGSDRGSSSAQAHRSSQVQTGTAQPLDDIELYYSGSGSGGSHHSTSTSKMRPNNNSQHQYPSPPNSDSYTTRHRSPPRDAGSNYNSGYFTRPGATRTDDPMGTVRLPRSTSHSQLLSLLSASMADASSLAGYPSPPYPPAPAIRSQESSPPYQPPPILRPQESSPPKRNIPRVPAPAYKSESEPEVWPLTRELVNEFKEYARMDVSAQQASTVRQSQVSASERARKTRSFQLPPGQTNPFADQESSDPGETTTRFSPPSRSPPAATMSAFNPPQSVRGVPDRPLPNPPNNNAQNRLQPPNDSAAARFGNLFGQPASKSTQAYSIPLPTSNPVSPSTSGSTLQSAPTTASGSSGSSQHAYETAKPPVTQASVISSAVVLREVKESPKLVDDRDEGDDDVDVENSSGGWQVVTQARIAALGPEVPSHASPQPAENPSSPLATSMLIQTESDDQLTSMANTPRNPAGSLPPEQPNSIQQLLMALQMGTQPVAAPVPTYPSSEFAPTYPSLAPFERYPSRQASVGGPPLSAAPTGGSWPRPMAPIPPTPVIRGRPSDSTPRRPPSIINSVASSPYPGPLNPFLPMHYPASLASSPSHIPLPLDEPRPPLRGPRASRSRSRRRPPPSESGDSTVPLDTESEGEENEDDVWLDEPSDVEMNGPFHPDFITSEKKRKQKFEQKWRNLVRQFRELDNMTDSTMFLMANNPDQRHTHLVLSRSVMTSEEHMLYAQAAQQSFAAVAEARRQQRAAFNAQKAAAASAPMTDEQRTSAAFEQLSKLDVNSINGEENLKQALDFAITSLKQLHDIYEEREQRRREEAERQQQEQTSIQALLQYLGLTGSAPQIAPN